MVIVSLQGGLGNQLFQYAAGLSLEEKQNIYFDLSFLKKHEQSNENFQARNFELSIFNNINYQIINPLSLRIHLSQNKKLKLFRKLLPWGFPRLQYINEDNLGKTFPKGTSFYLQGYFQDPKIFENISSRIISRLQFPKLPAQFSDIEKKINSTTSISLHVRRGDYLNEEIREYHGILPLTYYKKAVEIILKNIKNPHFFIFSDDINWCKDYFDFIEDKTIASKLNAPNWVDMYLMSICSHHIIANSTFSWWAAWLNKNEEKIVIAPKNWFVNEKTKILLKEWIVV